jgi:hypothetical protein
MTRFLRQLHERLAADVGVETVITLRTNVSVPRSAGSRSYVQRQLGSRSSNLTLN